MTSFCRCPVLPVSGWYTRPTRPTPADISACRGKVNICVGIVRCILSLWLANLGIFGVLNWFLRDTRADPFQTHEYGTVQRKEGRMGFLNIRCVSYDAQRFLIEFKGIYSVSKILENTKVHVHTFGKKSRLNSFQTDLYLRRIIVNAHKILYFKTVPLSCTSNKATPQYLSVTSNFL